MKKDVVVIGLGAFGHSVVKTLVDLGHNVLAMDISEEKVNKNSNLTDNCVICDSTDESALKSLGVVNYDIIVVAIGKNMEASILTTLILKDMGHNNVIVKAIDDNHARIVEKIGATKVVNPEKDTGYRTAHMLISESMIDFLDLNDKYSIIELLIKSERITNIPLAKLDIIQKHNIVICAIERGTEIIIPNALTEIEVGDGLIIIGSNKDIKKFEEKCI